VQSSILVLCNGFFFGRLVLRVDRSMVESTALSPSDEVAVGWMDLMVAEFESSSVDSAVERVLEKITTRLSV